MSDLQPQRGGRTIVVVNPTSGGGRAAAEVTGVCDVLVAQGHDPEVIETRSAEHAEEAGAGAAAADLVVAIGGDGLLGRVAAGVVRSGALLAPVPAGRGNDFARAIGVPLSSRAAAEALAVGTERRIDVGVAAGHVFLGVASVGFDTVANTIANETRWVHGSLVYAWGGVRALVSTRPRRFRLTVDDEVMQVDALNVAVGNSGRYGGGIRVCPDASLDDGQLDLVVQLAVGRVRLTSQLLKGFAGTHVEHDSVITRRARRVLIEGDEPLAVFADGDPIGVLPIEVTVQPASLRLLV
jgi:YegS/Rv2252/BmrU family lipid kinase